MPSVERGEAGYAERWAELNRRLRRLERGAGGLPAALAALHAEQLEAGFLRKDRAPLRRYSFQHPARPSRVLRAQYNPSRMLRFGGAGTTLPPHGVPAVSGGCFLCAANIQWQQAGLQLGYEIDLSSTDYVAWANPFPLLPGSCVVAARAHVPQGWERNGSGPRLERVVKILRDLVALSRRLPGFIVFHNGVGAGAAIPSHLHFHVLQRQAEDGPFPLEVAAREEGLAPHGSVTEYPLEALYWCGEPAGAVEAAAAWIRHWVRRNAATESKISANIVSGFDFDRGAELYFVPRDQSRSHSPEISGGIGGLEVLGEIPFCTAEEGRRLERGEVDYHTIERILASVRFR